MNTFKFPDEGKKTFLAFPKSDYTFKETDRTNIAGLSKNINKISCN